MKNLNTPKWNLDSIFPSIESAEYKKAVEDYKAGMESLKDLLETGKKFMKEAGENFDFPSWLKAYLKLDEEVTALASTLGAYSYIIYSVDTTNTEFLNNISRMEDLGLDYDQISISFRSFLLANSAYLDDFFTLFPEFEDYRYLLNEELEETKHQMSAKEENLAGDMQKTGGDAWGRLQEQIISNLKDEETGKTFNQIRNDACSGDAETRKKAYQTELKLLKQNEIALAACLNNLKGETTTLNGRRNWTEAIERSLASNRMSRETLSALIGAIEDSLPKWREYFKIKAEFLQKNGMTKSETAGKNGSGIAFYDLFAPMTTENSEKTWTFEEARDYIINRYDSFSKDMGDFARNAFEKNWIDAEVRPGKVGGAYDEDFALTHESRILSNFTGEFSDVITLAHELGHAYHFSCMKGKPAPFYSYPMTLAETASTFAETIVKQDMIANSEGNDKLKMIDLDLQDTSQTLVDILSRFYFESSVFEARKTSELNSDDFCRLMKEAQEKSYGSGLNNERHEYIWAVKSHYYSTGLDFYNFPYAFGQLFGAGLYATYKKEGASFAQKYAELLSNTGNMSCEELCKKAGFDITKKDFWNNGIEMYIQEIETLKTLIQ